MPLSIKIIFTQKLLNMELNMCYIEQENPVHTKHSRHYFFTGTFFWLFCVYSTSRLVCTAAQEVKKVAYQIKNFFDQV